MKKIDITGQRFGKLTAIGIDRNSEVNRYGELLWLCKCDCGNYKSVRGSHLRNGYVKSCGCLKSPKALRKNLYGYKAKKMPFEYNRKYGCSICADKAECLNLINEKRKVICKYAKILDPYGSYSNYDKAAQKNIWDVVSKFPK